MPQSSHCPISSAVCSGVPTKRLPTRGWRYPGTSPPWTEPLRQARGTCPVWRWIQSCRRLVDVDGAHIDAHYGTHIGEAIFARIVERLDAALLALRLLLGRADDLGPARKYVHVVLVPATCDESPRHVFHHAPDRAFEIDRGTDDEYAFGVTGRKCAAIFGRAGLKQNWACAGTTEVRC